MVFCTAEEAVKKQSVGMGQIVLAEKPTCLTAVLGSCVGVALYHPRLHLGILGHVVLPVSHDTAGQPGKFADTAIPHMLQQLATHGATRAGLIAKVAGGACMFANAGPMQIGDSNIAAVLRALESAGVRLDGKDVGGTSGRRMCLSCETGEVTVEAAGKPPRIL
jgi:chemotaxis protein CheD